MKILFLTSYVDPGAGPSVLYRLAQSLKRKGHEVRILTTRQGFDCDIIKSIKLAPITGFANRIINKLVPNYFGLNGSRLLGEIEQFNPDVVNIHWTHGGFGSAIPLRLIPKVNRTWPVFWTLHDLWPITATSFFEFTGGETLKRVERTPIQKIADWYHARLGIMLRYKVLVLGAAAIHTISPSKWLKNLVDASPVFKSACNHHIPNGIDIERFRPMDKTVLRDKYGVPAGDKVILFLAANLTDERKGFYYFVRMIEHLKEAAPDLLARTTTLLVGANGSDSGDYLPMKVRQLGRTRDPEVLAEYYNLADVFISASLADNFPSTALESIACGTPVVAFDVGGLPEIVIHGQTGFLSRSKDLVALADSTRRLLEDGDLRDQMGRACRSLATEQFSMDRFSERYVDVFGQAIAGTRCGSEGKGELHGIL